MMKKNNLVSFFTIVLLIAMMFNLCAVAVEATEESSHNHSEEPEETTASDNPATPEDEETTVLTPEEYERAAYSYHYLNSDVQTASSGTTGETGINPDGTPAGNFFVFTPNSVKVMANIVGTEHTADRIVLFNNQIATNYPTAIMLDDATQKYNGHSYAWHSQNIDTNNKWVFFPIKYFDTDNKSYSEVTTPQKGDVICYFDFTGRTVHSGIVVAVSNTSANGVCEDANRVTVQSKWGSYGLYEHRGDQCIFVTGQEQEGKASYVKYYRRTNHTHSFQYDSSLAGSGNICYAETCSGCGVMVMTAHDYTYDYYSYNNLTHEAECQWCDSIEDVPHDYTLTTTASQHVYTCPCGHSTSGYHSFTTGNDDGHSGTCSICNYTVTNGAHTYTYEYQTPYAHEITCACCDYTDTENHNIMHQTLPTASEHDIYCPNCNYTNTGDHFFEDWMDEDENWYEECMICGYIGLTARRMTTTDMEALPASILKQLADLSKTGVDEFFVRVDSKIFICYKNGDYYRIEYTDEPDADITPTVPPALLE